MKTAKWICTKCQRTFTRRWNANRHCDNIHFGHCYITLFREYLGNTRHNSLLRLPDEYSSADAGQITYQQDSFFKAKKNLILEPQLDTSMDPMEDYLDNDILLYDKLDELTSHYKQLENLFSHVPEYQRRLILGDILTRALYSQNPVTFIHTELEWFQNAKSRIKMLDDISLSCGINRNLTKELSKRRLKKVQKL